jgi:hypothetical protein
VSHGAGRHVHGAIHRVQSVHFVHSIRPTIPFSRKLDPCCVCSSGNVCNTSLRPAGETGSHAGYYNCPVLSSLP